MRGLEGFLGADMILEEMTMEEFRRALKKTRTLALPFGTVEAHGAHLPLHTDTLIIREVLKEASKRVPFFVAPALPYGVCTSTGGHPGTLGITPETLRRFTSDIVKDAYRKGMRNFILISGHGGGLHVNAMREAGEALVEELKGIRLAAFSIYEVLGKEAEEIAETRNDSHAGEMETSSVLFLAPHLVKGRSREEYPDFPKPFIVKDKMRRWKGAVWGDPGKATSEKGQRLFEIMVERVVELIRKAGRVR